jgi:DNA-binding transcriptional MerR regulator
VTVVAAPPESPAAPATERMTIDELARRAGTVASTVRLYQTRGLVPPPRKEGRVGYYGPGHLARMRLVAELQGDGFSLASIASLVAAWEQGRSLDDVLGLEAQITTAWAGDGPVVLRLDELATRLPGGAITPESVARAIHLGLITPVADDAAPDDAGGAGDGAHADDGAARLAVLPGFLAIGNELAELGVPVDEILDEYEHLQQVMAETAERFTRLFERHLWRPFIEGGMPGDDVRRLTDVLRRLTELAEGVVVMALRQSLRRAAVAFLATEAERLDDAGLRASLRPLAAAAGLQLPPD